VFCADTFQQRATTKEIKNLWQDNIEGTPDTPDSGKISKCSAEPLLVIRGSGIEAKRTEVSISELGDSSAYKVVMIERQGAIGHGLVPK
jgi:hypothetical protein